MSVLLCFLISAIGFVVSFEAEAQVPLYNEAGRSFEHRNWQFDLQSTYYQATGNYTKEGGQYANIPSGNDYHLLDFDFGLRWIPKSNWGIYTSTRVSNAESKDATNTRQNSSFTQIVFGTDLLLFSGKKIEFIPDFSVTVPLQRVDVASDEVLNSEGAVEATAKLIGRAHWGRFEPFAFAGFTYRDEDRSSLVPYGAGAELQLGSWIGGGEVRGSQTVIKDKYTNDTYKREIVAARDGGALRYYSVDPSLLETNFWLRTRIYDSWGLKFGGGTSITGASTAAGWNVLAGINYSFQPSTTPSVSRPYQPVEDPARFQEETNDGVDQNLFRAPQPAPPESAPKAADKAKAKAVEQKKKLKKELDQTEFQIELKHTKPRKKH